MFRGGDLISFSDIKLFMNWWEWAIALGDPWPVSMKTFYQKNQRRRQHTPHFILFDSSPGFLEAGALTRPTLVSKPFNKIWLDLILQLRRWHNGQRDGLNRGGDLNSVRDIIKPFIGWSR